MGLKFFIKMLFSSKCIAIDFGFPKLKFCFEFLVHSVKWRWDGWQHFIDSHFKVNFVECQPFWSSIYQQSNFFTLRILPLKASCMMPAPASCTVDQKIFVKSISRKTSWYWFHGKKWNESISRIWFSIYKNIFTRVWRTSFSNFHGESFRRLFWIIWYKFL